MTVKSIQITEQVITQTYAAKNESAALNESIFTKAGEIAESSVNGGDKEQTIAAIQKEIKSGNAEFVNGIKYMFRQMDRHKLLGGAFIMLDSVPEGCKTLGDVKRKLHLPDGCLKNNRVKCDGGGNFDNYPAYAPISISVEVLTNSLGMSRSEIKALFDEQ